MTGKSTKTLFRLRRPCCWSREIPNYGFLTVCSLALQVVQTNPVMEAFGNAKTVRNDNSSRFVSWHILLVEPDPDPQGSSGSRSRGLKKICPKMLNYHRIILLFCNIVSFNELLLMRKSCNYEIILWFFQKVLTNNLDPDWDCLLDPDPGIWNTGYRYYLLLLVTITRMSLKK